MLISVIFSLCYSQIISANEIQLKSNAAEDIIGLYNLGNEHDKTILVFDNDYSDDSSLTNVNVPEMTVDIWYPELKDGEEETTSKTPSTQLPTTLMTTTSITQIPTTLITTSAATQIPTTSTTQLPTTLIPTTTTTTTSTTDNIPTTTEDFTHQTMNLFEHPHHQGTPIEVKVSDICTPLPSTAKAISSIQTYGHCVLAFMKATCKGRFVSILDRKCEDNFEKCGIDNKVRALKLC